MHRPPKPTTPKRTISTRTGSLNRLNATVAARDTNDLSRRVLNPRRSVMPSSSLSETIRTESEPEFDETEVLYNDYLLALAASVVVKKKAQENEKILLTQVASLSKKKEECDYMFRHVHNRIRDIQALNYLENNITNQLNEINNFLEVHEGKIMENLNKIYSVLESSDKLTVKNIIISVQVEDSNTLQKILDEFNKILSSIINFLPESANDISSVNKNLKEYKNTVTVIEKQLQLVHENLEKLHFNMLKAFSLLLSKASE